MDRRSVADPSVGLSFNSISPDIAFSVPSGTDANQRALRLTAGILTFMLYIKELVQLAGSVCHSIHG